MVALVLYQPDIPQNAGTILRMAACLNVTAHIIEPTGFDLSDRALRRAGLDYLQHVDIQRHISFAAFEDWRAAEGGRLLLLTTHATHAYTAIDYAPSDILMLGRESAGVPEDVHDRADHRLAIPMQKGLRSLNVALAAAMVIGEALRQESLTPTQV